MTRFIIFLKKCWRKRADIYLEYRLYIFIVLWVVFWWLLDSHNVCKYSAGLVSGGIGIFITVAFVQRVLNIKNAKNERNLECKKILRAHSLMKVYFEKYKVAFYEVVTPLKDRNEKPPHMPKSFKVSDMVDLYSQSILVNNIGGESCIEYFYRAERNIKELFVSMLLNIDFKYFKELQDILIGFVNMSDAYDVYSFVKGAQYGLLGKEKRINVDSKMLKEKGDSYYLEWKAALEEGKHIQANLLMPYMCLYTLLQKERDLLFKYNNLIATLEKERI